MLIITVSSTTTSRTFVNSIQRVLNSYSKETTDHIHLNIHDLKEITEALSMLRAAHDFIVFVTSKPDYSNLIKRELLEHGCLTAAEVDLSVKFLSRGETAKMVSNDLPSTIQEAMINKNMGVRVNIEIDSKGLFVREKACQVSAPIIKYHWVRLKTPNVLLDKVAETDNWRIVKRNQPFAENLTDGVEDLEEKKKQIDAILKRAFNKIEKILK